METMNQADKRKPTRLVIRNGSLSIPYPPIDRANGGKNYGFKNLRAHPELINEIPETEGFPELRSMLTAINAPASPFHSLGCGKSSTPYSNKTEPG